MLVARIKSQLKLPKIVKPHHKDPKVLGKGLASRALCARSLCPPGASLFVWGPLCAPALIAGEREPPSPSCLILSATSPDRTAALVPALLSQGRRCELGGAVT